MSVKLLKGLPGLGDPACTLSLRIRGPSAFVRSPCFIARISLQSGQVEWLIERALGKLSESTWNLPRRIQVSDSDLWISEADPLVAEIISTECGGLTVAVRHAETGKQLWEHFVPIPEAAEWTERSPAWPRAQTEEIDAFIAEDSRRLIVCLFRQSRRSRLSCPARGIEVFSLPPYGCQTDAIRLEPLTGEFIWRAGFPDVRVGILERRSFAGIWSNSPRLGMLDFEAGTNATLYESSNLLGWPMRVGSVLAVPWHSKGEVGVDWIDQRGSRIRKGAWRQAGVRNTILHATESGLGLQTNDQMLWWLGDEESPLWSIRAKPYIYRVHCSPATNVFVGTDGNGGRLLGLDALSGRETLNLKPVLGGVGDLAKVPGHGALVATFAISRSYSTPGRLLVLSMKDGHHDLENKCDALVATWEHGAVCRAGRHGEAACDCRCPLIAVTFPEPRARPGTHTAVPGVAERQVVPPAPSSCRSLPRPAR